MTSTVAKYAVRRRRSIYKQHLDDQPTIQERQHDVRGFGRSPGVDSVLLAARSTIFLLRSFCFTPVSKRERERSYKGGEPNIFKSRHPNVPAERQLIPSVRVSISYSRYYLPRVGHRLDRHIEEGEIVANPANCWRPVVYFESIQ